ncbi:TPA: hypothetical protein ACPVZ6_001622 [Vibrio parahaemolyticus]|uniref:hypothetical protein n=1 Tax=Vibrio parahaemolyticus TaxID=670 RepID=UPI0004069CAE|nr:hypothetical protein [Vibrio parahaemolyticus]EKA7371675.1 hypothetical protein [Vibrio parahaemolyticus]ELA3125009.1 hypothetical protein [Vibrio parahaemolyticus]ELA9375739.1 hypothetical protein [Vibrio parahaemolyticus]MBE3763137.1 hypothetical protein [Vibrio parahaemolyticus]TOQ18715.1 hypothetical protein CGH00_23030 [Vibrio parahaemolyticus]
MSYQPVLSEFKGTSDTLVFTNDNINLTFGGEQNRFAVNLMEGEHQFFVRYHDADTPLIAAYLLDNEVQVEVETGVIEWLKKNDFVYKIEVVTENAEQSPLLPLDCCLTVNMGKTIKRLIEESH